MNMEMPPVSINESIEEKTTDQLLEMLTEVREKFNRLDAEYGDFLENIGDDNPNALPVLNALYLTIPKHYAETTIKLKSIQDNTIRMLDERLKKSA